MKKWISMLLTLMVMCLMAVPVTAADESVITQQPQNPAYGEYATAQYSVTVYGTNLQCTWYLGFEGKEYNVSDTGGSIEPWEGYAGETYGASKSTNGNFTTFTYYFGGIGKELDGSYLYAYIEDGHFDLTSDRAYINVSENSAVPPVTNVPAGMEVYQGSIVDLYCDAFDPDGGTLQYIWYETSSGNLFDIIAIDRGSETGDTLRCDTSEIGTRYYVCGVGSSGGGSTYTSVIPVTVIEDPYVAEPPVIKSHFLPDAAEGEEYSFQIDCSDPDAEFIIYYNPGKENEFDGTGLTLTDRGEIKGTPLQEGEYTFTVMAGNLGGEDYRVFTLTVSAKAEPEVRIKKAPDKVEYTQGERLDLKGMEARVYRSDGTYFDSVDGDKLKVTSEPLVTLGEQKIKVSYDDAFDFFIVTVKEAPAEGSSEEESSAADPSSVPSSTPSGGSSASEKGSGVSNESIPTDGSLSSTAKPVDQIESKPAASDLASSPAGTEKVSQGTPLWITLVIAVAAAFTGIIITLLATKKRK